MNLLAEGKKIDTSPLAGLIRQGESNVNRFEIKLNNQDKALDLAELEYTLYATSEKNTVASQRLEKQAYGHTVVLHWTVTADFTSVPGDLTLWIAGVDQNGEVVLKLSGEPFHVEEDPMGAESAPGLGAFEKALLSMKDMLDQSTVLVARAEEVSHTIQVDSSGQLAAIKEAGESQVVAVTAEGERQAAQLSELGGSLTEAGQEKLDAVNQAGAGRLAEVNKAGADALTSLQSAAEETETEAAVSISQAGKAQVEAVNTAGQQQAAAAKAQADSAKSAKEQAASSAAAAANSAQAAGAAASKAENAYLHPPYIGEDNCFWTWDTASGSFKSSGIIASGAAGKTAYQYAREQGFTGTEAQFGILLSKLKDLSNVDNARQYSAQNPPPYPVTSVAGRTGAVTLSKTDVGLSNVANVAQYSASNPPPYPVTKVAGRTGTVTLSKTDVGLGNVDNVRQYSTNNPPPYPVTSVAGRAGAVTLSKTDVGLSNVDNVRQSTATNLLNGAADGSLRSYRSATESADYKLGSGSAAFGYSTKASGDFSAAMGSSTTASGANSTAMGGSTEASGGYSTAMGGSTKASGNFSTAIGESTKAAGYASFASGSTCEARGHASSARGVYSIANNYVSISDGYYCFCDSTFSSYACGMASIAASTQCAIPIASYSGDTLTALNDSTISYLSSAFSKIQAGMEVLVWNTNYANIRWSKYTVKSVDTTNYTITLNQALPTSNFRVKWAVIPQIRNASRYYPAFALGRHAAALGYNSLALGGEAVASGDNSCPIGLGATVTGFSSTAIGPNAKSTGNSSVAIGCRANASGTSATAFGDSTKATESASIAMGQSTTASGPWSTATGRSTTASGWGSMAMGSGTTASGDYSTAMGNSTKASESYSLATGNATKSEGTCTHAGGWGTTAKGAYAVALGEYSTAPGYCSFAIGYHVTANGYQTVFGKYNTAMTGPAGYNTQDGSTMFILGNGTNTTPSNAFRIQANGQVFSKGSYSTSGADYAELFEWEDGNPNKEDRRGHFVALRGNKIHIAQPGEIAVGVISSTAAVIGNNPSETWQGMYLTDIWGDIITEYKEIPAVYETIHHPAEMGLDEEGNEIVLREARDETVEMHPEYKGQVPVLNPDYDPNQKYTARHERPEWGIVGLYGQLIVIDDGTCQVNGFCTCAAGGTATASSKGYLVIERLDETHIRILSNFLNTQQQIDSVQAQQDEAAIDTDFRLLMLELN